MAKVTVTCTSCGDKRELTPSAAKALRTSLCKACHKGPTPNPENRVTLVCPDCGISREIFRSAMTKQSATGVCRRCYNARLSVHKPAAIWVDGVPSSDHRLYRRWAAMHERCTNANHKDYARYGGRGISVCERWRDFATFVEDMQPTFEEGLTLDRIDNSGNYEPANCRWATPIEQANNRGDTS